jgi:ankyrin repeat protein/DNA-directed RNA polymerase subunit RPC12/RpoP
MEEAKTNCPKCGGNLAYPNASAGQEASCPHCNTSILLPKEKPTTAWIIAAVAIFTTVGLASILVWEHLGKHEPTWQASVEQSTNSNVVVLPTDALATGQLMVAVQYGGNVETVRLLLEKGANASAKDNKGRTPLHYAAMSGNVEIVKLLLEKGAAVNAKDYDGVTALILAAGCGQMSVVELLLEKGADINAKEGFVDAGDTALMSAASSGQTNVETVRLVKYLLDNGAAVNATGEDGETALMQAAAAAQTNAMKLLLERGADVNAKDEKGNTALIHQATFGDLDINTIKLLLDGGADVNASNNDGDTALIHAAMFEQTNVVELLLAHGVEINAVNLKGSSALSFAESVGYASVVQILKQAGATDR